MKKTIRLMSLLLALLMLLTVFVGCSNDNGGDDASSEVISGSDTDAVDTSTSGVPEGVRFDGKEVTIWYTTKCVAGESKFDLNPEDTSSNVNFQMVSTTAATQDRLGVKINYFDSGILTSDVGTTVRSNVMTGEDAFDIYQVVEWCSVELAAEGIYLNLKNMPYLSFDADWWDHEYMKEMTVGDKIYLLVGDVGVDRTRNLSCFFYNKDRYNELYRTPDGLYDVVRNNEWTMDRMIEMCRDAYVDVNVNNSVDMEEDSLGMILNKDNVLDGFFYGAGLKVTTRNADGIPEIDGMVNAQSVDLCEKVLNMVSGQADGIYTIPTAYDHEATAERLEYFGRGKTLFLPGFMYHGEALSHMGAEYGVIPYPLANEEQENYHSIVHNIISEIALPLTCKDSELACAVLEELAFRGNKSVLPVYYEETLKLRYGHDADTSEMIDIIRDGCVTDMALIYHETFNKLGIVLRMMAQEGKNNLSSVYAERSNGAKIMLQKLIDNYNKVS